MVVLVGSVIVALPKAPPYSQESGRSFDIVPFPGDHTGGDTPVPIPNTAVKPARADDSPQGESRSLPGSFSEIPRTEMCGGFLFGLNG